MTKNAIDQQIIYLDTQVDRLQKAIDLIQAWKHSEDCPGHLFVGVDGAINIRIKDMYELHEARRFLRNEYGSWEDKLKLIWGSGGEAHAEWAEKGGNMVIEIWMSCKPEDFPEELHRTDKCGFKRVSHSELSYVCEKEE